MLRHDAVMQDCQKESDSTNPLVDAARRVFAFVPTFWILVAFLSPPALLPCVKSLAKKFPTALEATNNRASEYVFEVSASLTQVGACLYELLLSIRVPSAPWLCIIAIGCSQLLCGSGRHRTDLHQK